MYCPVADALLIFPRYFNKAALLKSMTLNCNALNVCASHSALQEQFYLCLDSKTIQAGKKLTLVLKCAVHLISLTVFIYVLSRIPRLLWNSRDCKYTVQVYICRAYIRRTRKTFEEVCLSVFQIKLHNICYTISIYTSKEFFISRTRAIIIIS